LDAVSQLEQNINYGLTAELNDGQSVEISRRQATKLKAQLGFPT
jgi:two-component system LytT family response regulator